MDDAEGHLEKFKEKDLPLDTITAYNHLAIYLRWCMVNDLMRDDFLNSSETLWPGSKAARPMMT